MNRTENDKMEAKLNKTLFELKLLAHLASLQINHFKSYHREQEHPQKAEFSAIAIWLPLEKTIKSSFLHDFQPNNLLST